MEVGVVTPKNLKLNKRLEAWHESCGLLCGMPTLWERTMRVKYLNLGIAVTAALSALSSGAFAALCPAGGAAGSTLDAYIALGAGGCQIGDKTFSNFVYNGA